MKILFVTQWFDPEPGVIKGAGFVQRLIESGHEVQVVTGVPNYPEGRVFPGYRLLPFQVENYDGLHLHRLWLYPSHSRSSIGRILNYLSFCAASLLYGLLRMGRYDLAYVYHPPITVGVAAALFCAARRRGFVLEVQDLWPDTVATTGMRGSRQLVGMLDLLCNWVYRRATAIIVQSQGMAETLMVRGVPAAKITVIRNWADEKAIATAPVVVDPKFRLGDGRFTFLYGGNLGKAQMLGCAIRAAKQAARRVPRIELLLVGEGVESRALRVLANEIHADNVRFVSRVPQGEVVAAYRQADALFIHLAPDPLFEITIPQKTQLYLAIGKPIVAAIRGEAGQILSESGAARVVAPGNVDALADAMVELAEMPDAERNAMGYNGRRCYESAFSFEAGMKATLRLLAALEQRPTV